MHPLFGSNRPTLRQADGYPKYSSLNFNFTRTEEVPKLSFKAHPYILKV